MATILGSASKLFGFIQSNSITFLTAITTGLTYFAENFISDSIFECYCLNYDDVANSSMFFNQEALIPLRTVHTAMFIATPAVILFCISLAVNEDIRRCLAVNKSSWKCARYCLIIKYLIPRAAIVLVAPTTWIFLVFLNGGYLECIMSVVPTNCIPETSQVTSDHVDEIVQLRLDNLDYRQLSQIIAWSLLGVGSLLAIGINLGSELFSKTTYYQKKMMDIFQEKELESFNAATTKIICDELKKKWKVFINSAHDNDWDEVAELPLGGSQYYEDTGLYYYGAFHEWEPPMKEGDSLGHQRGHQSDSDGEMYADVVQGRRGRQRKINKPSKKPSSNKMQNIGLDETLSPQML